MRKILKRGIAIVLVMVLGCGLFTLYGWGGFKFSRDEDLMLQFYSEPENSLDGVLVGSSAAYRYWVPTEAFSKSGMAVYVYGTQGMPILAVDNIIEDIRKTQDPEFIIIEIRPMIREPQTYRTRNIRRLVNYMKPSYERLRIIAESMLMDIKYDTEISKNPLEYRFPEDRGLEEFTRKNVKKWGELKGFRSYQADVSEACTKPDFTTERGEPTEDQVKQTKDLLEYCDTLDCDVLFVATLELSILVQSINTQTSMQHSVVLPEVSCMLPEEVHQGSMYRFASGYNM